MKILAIDTATEACSAALWLDGAVAERYQVAPRQHTELILRMVEDLLAESGVRLAELDAIAYGRGPGAFTGVRIGVGVVQGLAFGAGVGVVPVSDLRALARGALDSHGTDRVLAAIDARMGEVYWGAFVRGDDGLVVPMGDERVISPERIPLPDGEGWFGAGTGWGTYRDALLERLGGKVSGTDPDALPRARDIAELAVPEVAAGRLLAPEQALPTYLRDEVAKKPSR